VTVSADDGGGLGGPDRSRQRQPHPQRALVELGQELRTEQRHHREAGDEHGEGGADHEPPAAEGPREHRPVEPEQRVDERRLAARSPPAKNEAGQRRDEREGEGGAAQQREAQREGHGSEDPPLHALEREEGHEGGDDDRGGEELRRSHLGRALDDQREQRPHSRTPLLEQAEDVLDHEDGRVHDDPEVHRSHRDQVGGDVARVEEDERAQQRQRDDQGDHGRGPEVGAAQERDQHHEDEQDALGHVLEDGVERAVDEVGAVVVRHDPHAAGQGRVDLLDLLPHALQHLERVLALAQQDHALDHVVAVVLAHQPEPDPRAHDHGGQVADADGRASLHGHGHVADVPLVADEPEAAHDVHLGAVLDVGAARVAIPRREGVEHLLQRDAVGLQLQRVDEHLVLLGGAAEARDVDDAGHLAELPLDHPVLERLELQGRGAGRAHERVAEDLAHRRRVRGERGLGSGREVDLGESLEGLLADVGAVGVVLEDDGDDGKAEDRDRAHRGAVGDAVHLVLDRDRHQPLHLLGGVAGKERDDLDLHVRDVRIRLDGQAAIGRDAHGDEQTEEGEDEYPLPEAEGDDRPQGLLASAHAASRSRLPCVTTRASSASPDSTGTAPSRSGPADTATRR